MAFILVFPPTEEDEHYYVLPYFWLPEETLPLRVRRDHAPYDVWERQGYLKTTEGNVVHYGYLVSSKSRKKKTVCVKFYGSEKETV